MKQLLLRLFVAVIVLISSTTNSLYAQPKDSSKTYFDSLKYPISDRRGDRFTWSNKNPFDLKDTGIVKESIEYDSKTKQYFIKEKIGKNWYRKPTALTFEEFYRLKTNQDESNYFRERADALDALNKKSNRPKMRVFSRLFDRTFGIGPKGKVDITKAGSVDLMLGYQGQITNNPTLPERARSTGGLDFNMNSNLNVNANIGDKFKLPINYNTLANFDFSNQLKLDYKGMDDEILRSFEAGNISFQSKGTLIPSAQNLFGIKTQLQFGKLSVTAVLANQRSQSQNQRLQGGATLQNFNRRLSDYDENRNFLMAQYFRKTYNKTMSTLPQYNTQVQVQRIEVWVTNRNGATTDARDIVGFMDLGERDAYRSDLITSLTNNDLPDNGANSLYNFLKSDSTNRKSSQVVANLNNRGFRQVNDFEKIFARKLNPNEYYFNPQAGFISLNGMLQPDDVLAVAYQYTANGKVYQVGEFSQDVGLDSQGVQRVLFLKLLKATSARVNLPIWGLMMKNIYTLELNSIAKDGFQLNIVYQQPSGGVNRYLPESNPATSGKALIRVLNLDRLNNRNDPQPDGVFDYIEGSTIISQSGKIIFPLLEPFGSDLKQIAFSGLSDDITKKYIFQQLYDSIKAIAQTKTNLDRFLMQGQAKGSGGSEIYLGAFNIPQGSVRVSAGGQQLVEGQDFTVDYNLGSVKIINQAIINSNVPLNVGYENNAQFGMIQRGFWGLRLDYAASKKLSIGATYTRLNERPFFTKMNVGDDPIRNTMMGVDFSYKSSLPSLTRLLNKLPFYSTKAPSSIAAYGEGAYFQPGHPPQIGSGGNGLIYVDDFEGTRSSLDLRFPLVSWALASTPVDSPNAKFPEALLSNDLNYNNQRAKIAWYNIEPGLQDRLNTNNPLRQNLQELSDPRVRLVYTNELFPQQSLNINNTQITTFDISYYPTEIGPYNYETSNREINEFGKFRFPKNKWGGLMRSLDQTDFETNNFEFIDFWIQDPFIKAPSSTGGKLVLNLGNLSEDLLKDGRRFYENGLNTPNIAAAVDSSTVWGKTPVNPIQVTQAFSNDPNDRPYQDVGLDGLDDDAEKRKFSTYIQTIQNNFSGTELANKVISDPSKDNYVWFRDSKFSSQDGILKRYKNYNSPQGNSPIAGGSTFTPAATLYPDNEDLNRDNTLNETEDYYAYQVDLFPGMDVSNNKYITDVRKVSVRYANGTAGTENWYLFRVPIKNYTKKVGNIPDFKSIRFMRMYLTDFEDSITLRFAKLDLVRNQWRQFTNIIDTTGSYTPLQPSQTTFNTLAVNLEENSARTPVNYVIPCGIERVQQLSNNGVNLLQNEQAMSLQVKNLQKLDSRGVIKTLTMDFRQYGKLSMFVHAEDAHATSNPNTVVLQDNQISLVVRIGQDFLTNYYEIKYPLKLTAPGRYSSSTCNIVWPELNNLDFALQDLVKLKNRRNFNSADLTKIYREIQNNRTLSVMGNPNLGQVTGMMIAVENSGALGAVDAEVWVNELRLSEINENSAYAALGRVDVTLADLGRLSVSGNMYTQGWGSLESRINDRQRDNLKQFDASLNIDAGKLLPKQLKLSIPVFASYSNSVKTPEYDPYDLDIKYVDKLNAAKTSAQKDSIRKAAVDETTIKTINLTNVKFMPGKNPKLWSLSNFDLSFSYTQTTQTSPVITLNDVKKYKAGFGYSYNKNSKFIEPFKKLIKSKSKWLTPIKEVNFNLTPSLLTFRADIDRQYGMYIPRVVNTDITQRKIENVDTTFDKYFTFNRIYNMRWDFTKSINLDFSATNNARVDEPYGALDTKEKRDSMWKNFFKGGRTTLYTQRATSSYNFPLGKLPISDWITARYSYATSYTWTAASLLIRNLGNTIENTQENIFNAEFDLLKLYSKVRWLRDLNSGANSSGLNVPNSRTNRANDIANKEIPDKAEFLKDLTGKKRKDALKKWRKMKKDKRIAMRMQRQAQPFEYNFLTKTTGSILSIIKRVSVNYTEGFSSRIPGWRDSTQILGQNWKSMQPGLDYIFGRQPDTNWLNDKGRAGLIVRDSMFNLLYRQNYQQKLSINAMLEPIRELTINISFEKTFSKEYTELFKDTTYTNLAQKHLNPYASGGFSVSWVSFSTLFERFNPNKISETFHRFENNRLLISQRYGKLNPYSNANPVGTDGYAYGYGKYAQNVIIPAFLAAYTKTDPNNIALIKETNRNIRNNPFSGYLPKPNWRLNYTGLSRIPALAKYFTSINLSHGYTGTLSMNSFTSALNFADPFGISAPGFYDSTSKNFIPFFLVPNVNVQESFSPLIGIDLVTNNQINFKFEYKKSRQMSLSLIDYQLSEMRSTEWSIGAGYRKKGLKFPFKLPFMKSKELKNDISFRLDLSFRDDANSNSRLDNANAYGTGGQKVITIQPSIDYVLNNRLNIRLFFDQRRTTPYISTSPPTIVTRAGLQLRIALAP